MALLTLHDTNDDIIGYINGHAFAGNSIRKETNKETKQVEYYITYAENGKIVNREILNADMISCATLLGSVGPYAYVTINTSTPDPGKGVRYLVVFKDGRQGVFVIKEKCINEIEKIIF